MDFDMSDKVIFVFIVVVVIIYIYFSLFEPSDVNAV